MKKLTYLTLSVISLVFLSRISWGLDGHIQTTRPVEELDSFVLAFSTAPNILVGASINFSGHATQVSYKVVGATATVSASYNQNKNSTDTSSMTILAGQSYDDFFTAPTASPTIVTYSLQAGATLQIRIVGVKADR